MCREEFIALVRGPEHETAKALARLPKGEDSSLIVSATKCDALVEQDPFNVVKELMEAIGIEYLDIVIANAGGGLVYSLMKDVNRKDIVEHIELYVYNVVSLYQATRDLLEQSTSKPVYANMGSGAGFLA